MSCYRGALALSLMGLVLAGPAALAQGITRSGPDASPEPIVNNGALDFIRIEGGATIDAGPDGASILNGPAGDVGLPDFLGVTIDGSTIAGSIVNQGRFVSGVVPALGISGSTIAGGIVNQREIVGNAAPGVAIGSSTVGNGFRNSGTIYGGYGADAVDIVDSHIAGGILNSGGISASGPPFYGLGLLVSGGTVSGGVTNTGTIYGGIYDRGALDLEPSRLTGGITNAGTIAGATIRFSPVGSVGLLVGGASVAGGLLNTGRIEGGVREMAAEFSGDLVNRGTITSGPQPALAGIAVPGGSFGGSIVNAAGAEVTAIDAVEIDAAIGGTLRNDGLLRGLTSDSLRYYGLSPRGIVLGPNAQIAGGIVNTGTIEGGYDETLGRAVAGAPAIDLTAATHPTRIDQQAGAIIGDVLMSNGVADTLVGEGGLVQGSVTGDAGDRLQIDTPANGLFSLQGAVSGLGAVAVLAGHGRLAGSLSAERLTIGSGQGRPAALQLTAGTLAQVGSLSIGRNGTLATEVTAAGAAGQLVAGTASIGGRLEIDVSPGSYAATTVYDNVVTAPGLGTPGVTFRQVKTDTPGFKATVSYDNGTADVTLTRVGHAAAAVASATAASPAAPAGRPARAGFAAPAAAGRAEARAAAGPAGGRDGGRHGGDRHGRRS